MSFDWGRARSVFVAGLWDENPVSTQVLGICSALAVTTRLENALVMTLAVVFCCVAVNGVVSLLRHAMPRRVRLIAEVSVIATLVVVFDQVLKAWFPAMAAELGPYVGLIVTNCIVMGRAEAFALSHDAALSMVDGLANGLGYGLVLVAVAAIRELAGTGALLGHPLLPAHVWAPNQMAVLAPGAFFVMGFLAAFLRILNPKAREGGNS